MEFRVVQENPEIRDVVKDIVRDHTDIELLYRLLCEPRRRLCILSEHRTILTVTGKEDGIITVNIECPSIRVFTEINFEILELL